MSRDIIIHYAEQDGKIIVSTVEHTLTAPLLAKALPLETLIATLRKKNPDDAERAFGAAIFALIDLSSDEKLGIRDYSAITSEWEAERADGFEEKAAKGDAVAQFELAMTMIDQGLRTKSKLTMNDADTLLRRAAAGGNTEAAEYLVDLWPALKDRSDRGFK